ncbi:MAG: B12-binding domain-containing radical SAM protein [Lachnospiraceae bacterium]|nr:B12-binding domain-containing radical SAM protein [Lachnospiraceae bacterium]
MKITFIRLNMFEHISSDAMKPLLFGIIKSLTPKEFEIEFIDERAEKLPEKIDSDVIAFSVETYTAKRAYILAKKYKTEHNIIVMGGFHPTVMPEECLQYADSVIVGDAEDTWEPFLRDCEKGNPKPQYISGESGELKALVEDKSVYKHKYYGIGVYQISRGCKFNCDFCSIKTMYKQVRRKSAEDVVQELSQAKEKIIFFVDDNLFYDRQSAIELFRKMAPLKKKWACQISMDVAQDDELLAEMKKSGCFLVLLGFESLNPESLTTMKKSANKAAGNYDEVIQRIYRHKMLIYGTFVFGYDHDDKEVFDKTFEFAVRNHLAVTNFNPLIPMPGTPVYDRMEQEGRLLYKKWWLSDRYRYGETAYQPRNMTPEELRDGCLRIRTQFYSPKCVLKRFFANPIHFLPWNFVVFLLVNVISRKEIHAKQGQMLGGILNETDVD